MAAQTDPLANVPPNFKSLQHYIKTATEHDKRDPVVSYYCKYQVFPYYKIIVQVQSKLINYKILVFKVSEDSHSQEGVN